MRMFIPCFHLAWPVCGVATGEVIFMVLILAFLLGPNTKMQVQPISQRWLFSSNPKCRCDPFFSAGCFPQSWLPVDIVVRGKSQQQARVCSGSSLSKLQRSKEKICGVRTTYPRPQVPNHLGLKLPTRQGLGLGRLGVTPARQKE